MKNQNYRSTVKHVIFCLVFLICAFYFLTSGVYASTSVKPMFQVSPVILNITLSPGKTYNYQVTVKNLLSAPLPLQVNLENLGPASDEEGSTPTFSELLKWSSIDQRDMIIPAGETKTLTLTIRLPNKIPLGGYYGTLFLEPVLPVKDVHISSVQAKVGVIMLANIGVPDPRAEKGEITDFIFDKLFYNKGTIKTNFQAKNISLYHFSAKPFVKIKQFLGPERTYEVEEKIILPGRSRSWEKEIVLDHNSPGFYHATLAVSVGNGHQITQTNFFIILPTYIILFTLLVILFIIIVARKKRLGKAMLIMLGREK